MFSERELYAALRGGEFFLEYLPITALADERCVGAEALIRWQRGDRVVPPLEFIPAIEDTLLSGLITYWVIDKVAEDLGDWLRSTPGAFISINVPPRELHGAGLLYAAQKSRLSDVIDQIVIEITERGVPDQMAVQNMNDRALYTNVLIALDDVLSREAGLLVFGKLKVDMVKVDKSYIDLIMQEGWPTANDRRLLRLLRHTQYTVICEGVEHRRQVEVLMKARVPYVQGWYYSRSLRAAAFLDYFATHAVGERSHRGGLTVLQGLTQL